MKHAINLFSIGSILIGSLAGAQGSTSSQQIEIMLSAGQRVSHQGLTVNCAEYREKSALPVCVVNTKTMQVEQAGASIHTFDVQSVSGLITSALLMKDEGRCGEIVVR